MIGNAIDYDKKYKDTNPIWNNTKMDIELKKYLKLLNGKNILDLGIGEGKNSIILSELGYNVTGVDYSKKALEICKNNCPNIKLIQSDIRKYNIENNIYHLIMSRFAMQFLHKKDVYTIIKNIKSNLLTGGLVYISVFSIDDPGYDKKMNNSDFVALDNDVFYKKTDNTYSSYFTKNEIMKLFSEFETISVSDEYNLDLSHGQPHYHGIIKYIGKKYK